MKKQYIFLLALTLLGCAKTKNDFIGKYQTKYTSKVRVVGSYPEKDYYDLCLYQIELFEGQEKSAIQGTGSIVVKSLGKDGFIIGRENETGNFDLTDIRVNNDTLEFSIENQLLKFQGKKLNGQIIKTNDFTVIGLDEHLTSEDASNKNPHFLLNKNGLTYYKETVDVPHKIEMEKQFYENQVNSLKKILAGSNGALEKENVKKAITDFNSRMK